MKKSGRTKIIWGKKAENTFFEMTEEGALITRVLHQSQPEALNTDSAVYDK